MKFVVFGAGGVGGAFGGRLALTGQEVWFVARGAHLAAMQDAGLRLNTPEGTSLVPPGRMTDDPARIGKSDVVLFCVKSYDTDEAARQLSPMLANHSVVITLQNGIDSEQRIQDVAPSASVFPGVAYVYANISAPGEITEATGPRKIVFGASSSTTDTQRRKQGEEIARLMARSGITAEWAESIEPVLWKKFIFIASVGGLTALTRLTLGEILAVDQTRQLLFNAMSEVHTLATRLNVPLNFDYVTQVFSTMDQFPHETRSSLYHDLIHGKPLELETLSGTVIRLATTAGVPTPIHHTIYRALLPYARRHARQREDR
jgi:2-dehydropantoate 2-reductase